jgi:hypothetical protein
VTRVDARVRDAVWDAYALSLAEKLEAGVPFSPADHESEDVDPVNAAAHALPPRQVAALRSVRSQTSS